MLPQGGTLRLQGGFGAFPGFFMFVRVDNAMTCNLKCCRGIQIEAEYKAIISTFFIKFFHILFELKLIERSHSNHFRFEENHHSARVGNEMLVQIYFFVEFFLIAFHMFQIATILLSELVPHKIYWNLLFPKYFPIRIGNINLPVIGNNYQ